ncbi:hypothetical protein MACH09_39180 [Vibrio sp. MACH09]|uniref:tetratricopeptide repeat protein n=1 Tax=Vibrio sp. MACH09 TaxID=3025122 RepID=UPI002793B2F1|nr:tetratricopeptide repeat protein [Vibrio sp. MACH09]GLO63410.1 hypothetical protein MACH09_39180 [Vibrio sp. MACH09]
MKSVCSLLLLLALFGCQSTNTVQNEYQQNLKVAELALTNGRPESAMDLYREMLKASPSDAQLLLLMGSAANQSGRYNEAMHYLKRGREIRPSGIMLRELGRAQLAIGELAEAINTLEIAAKMIPNDDVALNSLGVSYSLNKQYAKARESYQLAIEHKPSSIEYRNNLALAWMLDGNPQQAIRILYPIFQRGDASEKLRLNLALAYALKGDSESAKVIARDDLSQPEFANNSLYYQALADNVDREKAK